MATDVVSATTSSRTRRCHAYRHHARRGRRRRVHRRRVHRLDDPRPRGSSSSWSSVVLSFLTIGIAWVSPPLRVWADVAAGRVHICARCRGHGGTAALIRARAAGAAWTCAACLCRVTCWNYVTRIPAARNPFVLCPVARTLSRGPGLLWCAACVPCREPCTSVRVQGSRMQAGSRDA
eukprot:572049-Prymnesium_polylepis.2